jgi:hypothetical protein
MLELIRLLSKNGSERYFVEVYERFLDLVLRGHMETLPELLVEIVKLGREVGPHRFPPHILLRRLFDITPPDFWIRRNPEVALEVINFGLETGESKYFEKHAQEFFSYYHPQQLLNISPSLIIEAIKLAKRLGNNDYSEQSISILFEQIPPDYLWETSPENILTVIQLAGDSGQPEFAEFYIREFISRMHPRGLWEMQPELTIGLFKLMAKTGNRKAFQQYFEQFVHRLPHISIFERSPSLILEVIRAARELQMPDILEYCYHALLQLADFGEQSLELNIEILRLGRELNDPERLRQFAGKHRASKSRGKTARERNLNGLNRILLRNIGELPLDAVNDVCWLANETGDHKLLDEIESRISHLTK